jgi:hypothetical protein
MAAVIRRSLQVRRGMSIWMGDVALACGVVRERQEGVPLMRRHNSGHLGTVPSQRDER